MTEETIAPGQVWQDTRDPVRRHVGYAPDGSPILGAPHYLVLATHGDRVLLARACGHQGRWVQSGFTDDARRAISATDLASRFSKVIQRPGIGIPTQLRDRKPKKRAAR